jgi:secondary thiamine-phosphate synthase enzyme
MNHFDVNTPERNVFLNITKKVQDFVTKSDLKDGICYVFIPHTTAAVTINESADPDVRIDVAEALINLVPAHKKYRHSEGNSDSHIKASIIGSSEVVFVENGRLQLGTWQGIFFCEFDGPRRRQVWLKLVASQ